MVLTKVAVSSGSGCMGPTEKQPVMGVNEALTKALLVDEEMSRKTLVSVHMDQKQLVSVSTAVVHKDQSLPRLPPNEEMVRLTMALEAVACKVPYNGLQQLTLVLSVVWCEDQMVKKSSVLVHMDLKLLHVDSSASSCTCLG